MRVDGDRDEVRADAAVPPDRVPGLAGRDLYKTYTSRAGQVSALAGVDLHLAPGDGLGVVGPSGCGKSTLLHVLLHLVLPDRGQVTLDGAPVRGRAARRGFRRAVQLVPQDPVTSLDPRRRIGDQVREPLLRLGVEGDHDAAVAEALDRVGLSARHARSRPGEVSGGQAQRAAVARAIVTRPRFLLADEPVSGLDAPLRLQVLDLFAELRDQGLGLLVVTHDLSSIHRVCTDVLVLDEGSVAETGPLEQVLHSPTHPVTRRLVDAVPCLVC